MPVRTLLVGCLLAACGGTTATPARAPASTAACPAAVSAAVTDTFPGATQGPCEAETEDGQPRYEITLTRADGSTAEVVLTADGTLVATEEVVAAMPDAGAAAFATRYPGATPSLVEKITMPATETQYEITFGGKEVTFSAAGVFVGEEAPDADAEDQRE